MLATIRARPHEVSCFTGARPRRAGCQYLHHNNRIVTVTTIDRTSTSGHSAHGQRLCAVVSRAYHLHTHASSGRVRRSRVRVDVFLARPERACSRTASRHPRTRYTAAMRRDAKLDRAIASPIVDFQTKRVDFRSVTRSVPLLFTRTPSCMVMTPSCRVLPLVVHQNVGYKS